MWVNYRINDIVTKDNLSNSDNRDMEPSSLDERENGKHSGLDWIEIYNSINEEILSLKLYYLTDFNWSSVIESTCSINISYSDTRMFNMPCA